ncbi:MAG: hypothetical protein E6R04_11410 [Spirochaetes bacterium]|nr:MAG: hypothetical protein E6R04_11410 [Spirochaetota bacterium]
MATIKTRIDTALGVVSTNNATGIQIERTTENRGFSPFKVDSTLAVTGSATLAAGHAGVTTLSGSGVLTQVLPLASACPGAEFVFRSLSAHAHVLTGSQETAGTRNIQCAFSSSNGPTASGSKFTFGATVGNSVILKSDGLSFHVMSYSGSFTLGV